MNLIQLRYVKVVAETASFSAAARDCGVSQPTISNAVCALEAELGAKLFKRTTRRVELTSFGRDMARYIEAVLNSASDLEQQARALLNPQRKLLRVAFSPIIDSRRLLQLFEPFKQGRPDLEIIYKECNVDDLEARLDREQADLICGIRLRAAPERNRCVLYRDVLRYLPRGGLETQGARHSITLNEIARETLILTVGACGLAPVTRELFRRGKIRLREYPGQALSYQVLQEWSQLNIGAALLPESRIAGDAGAYPAVTSNSSPVMITYEAVWDKNISAPAHVKEFLKYLKTAVAALVKGGQFSQTNRPPVAQDRILPIAARGTT